MARLTSSARRDLLVIVACSVLLLFLLDFRYDVSTHVLIKLNQELVSTSSNTTTNTSSLMDDPSLSGFDEFGDVIQPKAVSGSSHRSSDRAKHKSIAASLEKTRPSTFDTKDRHIGQNKIAWADVDEMPITKLVRHSPGRTIMDNVFFRNGTLYLVHEDHLPPAFPEPRNILSSTNPSNREPTEDNLKVISIREARKLFGNQGNRIAGTSFICYDDEEVFKNTSHYATSPIFTLWRTYSSLDLSISPEGKTKLAQPRRFIAPNVNYTQWRSFARQNHFARSDQYVLHAAFPSMGTEFAMDWRDRAETLRTYVFDRIVLGDTYAAAREYEMSPNPNDSSEEGHVRPAELELERKRSYQYQEADQTPKSPYWWAPVRNNVLSFSGLDLTLTTHQTSRRHAKPVITYISPQSQGSRLKESDHRLLVDRLSSQTGWEVHIVNAPGSDLDLGSDHEQQIIRLAGRTTVLMGVHGAGLTSLLWMLPTERSTVVEFMPTHAPELEENVNVDFEYMARMLDIKYYGVRNNTIMTYPELPSAAKRISRPKVKRDPTSSRSYSDEIPLDVESVISLLVQRLHA